jgi:hypothetical protein
MIPALQTPAGVSMLPGVVSSSLSLVSSLPCKSVHLLDSAVLTPPLASSRSYRRRRLFVCINV